MPPRLESSDLRAFDLQLRSVRDGQSQTQPLKPLHFSACTYEITVNRRTRNSQHDHDCWKWKLQDKGARDRDPNTAGSQKATLTNPHT